MDKVDWSKAPEGATLSVERLRQLLEYDPAFGQFKRRVGRGPSKAGSIAGCLNGLGYVRICVDGVDYAGHRLAWLYHYGEIPEDQIDHINGNRADNRIANLRLANNSENNMNRPLQRNNTSGYKGVSRHKQSGLWFAYARAGGRRHSAGYHKTPEEAFIAASALRDRLHGDFARHDFRKVEGGAE